MLKGSKKITGLPVISIEEGEELGKVRMLIPDPHKPKIIGIVVEDREWFKGAKVVTFDKIFGIGESAVTITNKDQLSKVDENPEVEDILLRGVRLLGSRILTQKGEALGQVEEFYIERDGKIVAYELEVEGDIKFLPSEDVLTIGKGIIIAKENAGENLLYSLFGNEKTSDGETVKEGIKDEEKTTSKEKVTQKKKVKKEEKKLEGATPNEKNLLIASSKKEVDLKKIFQERQRKYLMGKKVIKDILARNGEVLVPKDTIIDEEILDRVQKEGKFLELSMSVDISG